MKDWRRSERGGGGLERPANFDLLMRKPRLHLLAQKGRARAESHNLPVIGQSRL